MVRLSGFSVHLREMLKLKSGSSPKRTYRKVVHGLSSSSGLSYTVVIETSDPP